MLTKKTLIALCLCSGILVLAPVNPARADAKAIEAVKLKIEDAQAKLRVTTDLIVKTTEIVEKLEQEIASLESLYERTSKPEYRRLLEAAYAEYDVARSDLEVYQAQYLEIKAEILDLFAQLEELMRRV